MTEPAAVVVVNYRSHDLLAANLPPLRRAGFRIVVVDNYSDRVETRAVAALCRAEGWYLVSRPNDGFGAGVNAGIEAAAAAGSDRFVILNPDAELAPAAAEVLVAAAAGPVPRLVAPEIRRPDGSVWFGGSYLRLADGRIRSRSTAPGAEVPWLTGACLAVTAESWAAVGGFADDYFLYWEDVDLSYRVLRAGGELEVISTATCVHAEGATQTKGGLQRSGQAKSALYYRYNIANRLVFAARNLDGAAWRRWLLITPRVAWEVLLQGGRRQFLHSPRPLIAAAQGVWTGFTQGRRLRRSR